MRISGSTGARRSSTGALVMGPPRWCGTSSAPTVNTQTDRSGYVDAYGVVAALIVRVAAAASAQLVVYDPVNHLQARARYAELILTYEQPVKDYQHFMTQARSVPRDIISEN